MEKRGRRSVDPVYSMCVQPSFIIGTNNEDGTANFAPITWVSVTHGEGDGYLLVISMSGTKRTKQNVLRTGIFSANLVSTDMLPLMDYFGSRHAQDGRKDEIDMQSAAERYWTSRCLTGAGGYMNAKYQKQWKQETQQRFSARSGISRWTSA